MKWLYPASSEHYSRFFARIVDELGINLAVLFPVMAHNANPPGGWLHMIVLKAIPLLLWEAPLSHRMPGARPGRRQGYPGGGCRREAGCSEGSGARKDSPALFISP